MRLFPLLAIEAVAFFMIIGETYLFFGVVVPLGPVPHNTGEYTVDTIAKILLTFGLGVLWFLVMIGLTRIYVRTKLPSQTPSPSS
ncbi:MAG TPA: hypothetical protein VFE91_06220 [Nitrososphaerales archaeon]|nr:hypothetical protein [Nitrososphaerales archaeon]